MNWRYRFFVFLTSATLFLCLPVGIKARASRWAPARARSQPSVQDLDEQVAYQRTFEAVLWAMPVVAIYRVRVGLLELPGCPTTS